MTPDEAYAAGLTAAANGESYLACPIEGEGQAARRWIDGMYDGSILLRDGMFALI